MKLETKYKKQEEERPAPSILLYPGARAEHPRSQILSVKMNC